MAVTKPATIVIAVSSEPQPLTVYNRFMAEDVIHISEEEAASDFAALMARVRAGAKSSSKMVRGLWRSYIPPNRCAAASLSASRWPKRTKKKRAKPRS